MTQPRPDIAKKEAKNHMEVLEMKNITVPFMAQQEMTQLRKESANSKDRTMEISQTETQEIELQEEETEQNRRAVGEYV